MDAVSRERGTAAVLHSPSPPSPGGIADARHEVGPWSAAGGMEKSSHVGTGAPDAGSVLGDALALRLAGEGLEDGGCCWRWMR